VKKGGQAGRQVEAHEELFIRQFEFVRKKNVRVQITDNIYKPTNNKLN